MKKIALILALLLLVSCGDKTMSKIKEEPEVATEEEEGVEKKNNTQIPEQDSPVGKPAPDFSLTDLNGDTKTLEDYQGKLLILDFFTTGCFYCVAEMLDLKTLQEKYPEKIAVVLVNIGEDEETLQKFIEERSIQLPVLLDKDAALALDYGFYGTPAHAFIDEEGNFLGQVMGQIPGDKMIELVDLLLEEH